MSHYPSNRDSSCKCKYCLAHSHMHQQRVNHQRIHNTQNQGRAGHHVEHLSAGESFPLGGSGGGGMSCAHRTEKSPLHYEKLEEPTYYCKKGNKFNEVEDPLGCRQNHFQELRKTWSEFARVCNCPNCKGSLQKERYLDKLAESADRNSAYKHHQYIADEDYDYSESNIRPNITHDCKQLRPCRGPNDYDYDQEQMHQQHEDYHMQHQHHQPPQKLRHMSSCQPCEVSSDERLMNPPGNVGCKCLTCSSRGVQKMHKDGGARAVTPVAVAPGPRCAGMKKARPKHHY